MGGSQNETGMPLVLLTLRFMIEKQINYDHPFGYDEDQPEARSFFQGYLDYLSQIKFDDLTHWSED